jgi:hypothetical protein
MIKGDTKKLIVEFFGIKNASFGLVNYKASVFKFCREYQGDLDQGSVAKVQELAGFKLIIEKMQSYASNANGTFS